MKDFPEGMRLGLQGEDVGEGVVGRALGRGPGARTTSLGLLVSASRERRERRWRAADGKGPLCERL